MNKKNSAIVRIICWSAVAVILTVVLIVGLVRGWNFSVFNFSSWNSIDTSKYSAGSASFPGDKIKNIEVNWLDGEVIMDVSNDNNISLKEKCTRKLSKKEQLHYYISGDTLYVEYRGSKKMNFFGFNNNLHKKLTIQLPKETASSLEDVTVNGVSSDILLDGLKAEMVQADTVSGDIQLDNIEADSLNVNTTSGDVISQTLTVHNSVTANTTSGDVTLEGSLNAVSHNSVSGLLSFTSDVCPEKVDANTTSGDIYMSLPENSGFNLSYDTVSGDWESSFPLTASGSHYTCGNGENAFHVETVSGDITINQSH